MIKTQDELLRVLVKVAWLAKCLVEAKVPSEHNARERKLATFIAQIDEVVETDAELEPSKHCTGQRYIPWEVDDAT